MPGGSDQLVHMQCCFDSSDKMCRVRYASATNAEPAFLVLLGAHACTTCVVIFRCSFEGLSPVAAAAAAAASEAATPAAPSDRAVRTDASAAQHPQQAMQPVAQAAGVQHLEVQQQLVALQPAPTGLKGRTAADSTGSKVGLDVPVTAADAVDAVSSMPTVGEHPHLPPIKTVSKRGRFVVTKLTPASTACCTPKSACAATTPTAAAAAAAGFGAVSAAEPAAEGVSGGGADLSVSSLGPLVTCPVCAVAQVMPQLPHQLSGQLLGLITEREAGGQQQQQQQQQPEGTSQPQGGAAAAAAAAAAACDAIAAAVSETQAAGRLNPEAAGSSSSTVIDGQQLAAAEGPFGGTSSSVGMQAPLPTCSSCGAPLPPMSQQEYQSAAAAAAAGVLGVAAATAAAHLQPAAAAAPGDACGSTSSSMQSSWHEAAVEVQGPHHVPDTQQGPSSSTPQGLLAIAAVRVLAARQREQQLAQQRKQQEQHPRELHDASSGGLSTSRTPGYCSSNHRGSMDPGHWAGNSCSMVGGGAPDLLSESSYQHSTFSSGRSSSSSILAQPCMWGGASSSTMHGAQHNSGAVGFAGFGGNDAHASAALPTHVGVGFGAGAGGRCYSGSPAEGRSAAAAVSPHASAADSPMRWAVQQRAAVAPVLALAEHEHVLEGPAAAVAPSLAAQGVALPASVTAQAGAEGAAVPVSVAMQAGEGAALLAAPAGSTPLSVEGAPAVVQDGAAAANPTSAEEGVVLPAAAAAVPASVSPVPSSATYWPRSHAAEWMDALGSAEASSNDCGGSRG